MEFRGLFSQVEPIEEGVGVFEPDAEPIGDFFFFGALGSFDFLIATNHLGATLAETRDVSLEEISRQTTQNFFRLFSKVPSAEAMA